jgi:hypothetical protein
MDAYRYIWMQSPAYVDHLDNATSRKGLNACQATFANKQYKSHQRVGLPSDIIESLATQNNYKAL